MCGRYELADDQDIEEINKIIDEINKKYYGTGMTVKTGEICPTDTAPVLSFIEGKPALSLMKWGFPKWDGKGVIINAKSETAAEKKLFAKPLMERRCVIPSSGFYEWKQKDGSKAKEKYLFTVENSPMLYMAGFYNVYGAGDQIEDQITDQIAERFVILSRKAGSYMDDVHHRMPVVLRRNELTSWLKDHRFISFAFTRDDIVLERTLMMQQPPV